MKKLLVLYKTPGSPEAFLDYYKSTHLKLVEQVPGLVSTNITLVDKTLVGEPGNFLIAEMNFADESSFKAAMSSPENAATGADLKNFADCEVTILTGASLAV